MNPQRIAKFKYTPFRRIDFSKIFYRLPQPQSRYQSKRITELARVLPL
jgi:hypothetical protein